MRVLQDEAFEYPQQHRLRLRQDLVVPETEDSYPLSGKKSLSFLIVSQFARFTVLSTVQFDCEPRLVTVKVQDIRIDRVLPTELETGQTPVTQKPPQQLLGICLLSS